MATVMILSVSAGVMGFTGVAVGQAATSYPSDPARPDPVAFLAGFRQLWQSSGKNDLHGTVVNAATLERNDQLAVWINNNATGAQQFRALQDSKYNNPPASTMYDQSLTLATGLGSTLGPLYVHGIESGVLPLTQALVNSSNGTAGAYIGTGSAKTAFSYPRPFLPTDPATPALTGDAASCSASMKNGVSLKDIRTGEPYADAKGNLKIDRVPDVVDASHQFSPNDVSLTAGYGTASLCGGGSFPSGHTTTAYLAGVTLATLLPELGPEILARTLRGRQQPHRARCPLPVGHHGRTARR